MKPGSSLRVSQSVLLSFLSILLTFGAPSRAQGNGHNERDHAKVVGGYFEEWGIYYAGYNVANLQQNGVAEKLTHLTYAPTRGRSIAISPGTVAKTMAAGLRP